MKNLSILLVLILTSLLGFSQAREDYEESSERKVYTMLISKDGKVKHVIKQGAMMTSKVDGKVVKGRWVFRAYPDIVAIIGKNGEVLGEVALNKELPLRITPPQQQRSGMSVGIGVGPVSISGLGSGSGMRNFDMKKYKATIDERPETREEKMRREHFASQERERKEREAAKRAKKEAKNAAKKSKKK